MHLMLAVKRIFALLSEGAQPAEHKGLAMNTENYRSLYSLGLVNFYIILLTLLVYSITNFEFFRN